MFSNQIITSGNEKKLFEDATIENVLDILMKNVNSEVFIDTMINNAKNNNNYYFISLLKQKIMFDTEIGKLIDILGSDLEDYINSAQNTCVDAMIAIESSIDKAKKEWNEDINNTKIFFDHELFKIKSLIDKLLQKKDE